MTSRELSEWQIASIALAKPIAVCPKCTPKAEIENIKNSRTPYYLALCSWHIRVDRFVKKPNI